MAETLIPDRPTEVVEAELQETMVGPAFHSNKMYVTGLPSGIRLAFAEGMPGVTPRFRTAVLLGYPDALALRDLLTQQLKDIEAQIKAAQANAQAASGSGDGH